MELPEVDRGLLNQQFDLFVTDVQATPQVVEGAAQVIAVPEDPY